MARVKAPLLDFVPYFHWFLDEVVGSYTQLKEKLCVTTNSRVVIENIIGCHRAIYSSTRSGSAARPSAPFAALRS